MRRVRLVYFEESRVIISLLLTGSVPFKDRFSMLLVDNNGHASAMLIVRPSRKQYYVP